MGKYVKKAAKKHPFKIFVNLLVQGTLRKLKKNLFKNNSLGIIYRNIFSFFIWHRFCFI